MSEQSPQGAAEELEDVEPLEGAASPARAPRDRAASPLMQLDDVTVAFDGRRAVKNVSFDVYAGEVTSLIGPSGSGKTTLLRALNRMHDTVRTASVTGRVLLDGADIYDRTMDPTLLRTRVGMVFQRPNPFPQMSIYDNAVAGLRFSGVRKRSLLDEAAEASLRAASLWDAVSDRLKKHASSLSGGEQQRLCIARALAVEPEVLLMDEPTSALDPMSTLRIERLIVELKDRVTIVIVTHNMQQARRVSDECAFLLMDEDRGGKLIEFGPTETLFTAPEDPRTLDYVSGLFG